jgi:hypothetical protein
VATCEPALGEVSESEGRAAEDGLKPGPPVWRVMTKAVPALRAAMSRTLLILRMARRLRMKSLGKEGRNLRG